MAATVTGSASAAATTVTLPAHNVGDCIAIYAWASSTTVAPTIPAAGGTVPTWTDIRSSPSTDAAGRYVLAWTIATATNHTSGTWTNAAGMAAVVVSGTDVVAPIAGQVHVNLAGTSWNAYLPTFFNETATGAPGGTAWPQRDFSGNSAVVNFLSGTTVTTFGAVPSGCTRILADTSAKICVNQFTVSTGTSTAAAVQTGNTSGNYNSITVEFIANNPVLVKYKGHLTTAASSGNIPPHSSGDIIVAWAANLTTTTIPTVPSAGGTVPTWTSLYSSSSQLGVYVGYTVATASNHTSGTWTNAASVAFTVLSKVNSFPGRLSFGALAGTSQASSTTHTGPAVTPIDATSNGLLLHAAAINGVPTITSGNGFNDATPSVAFYAAPKFSSTNGAAVSYSTLSAVPWASAQLEVQGNIGQSFFNCA